MRPLGPNGPGGFSRAAGLGYFDLSGLQAFVESDERSLAREFLVRAIVRAHNREQQKIAALNGSEHAVGTAFAL